MVPVLISLLAMLRGLPRSSAALHDSERSSPDHMQASADAPLAPTLCATSRSSANWIAGTLTEAKHPDIGHARRCATSCTSTSDARPVASSDFDTLPS